MSRIKPLSESEITKQIRGVLRHCKIFHYKAWQGPMSQKGVADIIGIHDGRFLAIEIKHGSWWPPKPGTKQFKHYQAQKDFLDQVNAGGGVGFFAQGVEEVIERLGLKVWVQ